MARASSSSSSSSQIRDIVGQFVGQLSALVEHDAVSRAREVILSAFAGGAAPSLTASGKRRGRPPGRPSAGAVPSVVASAGRKRRKAPIQLCPVPGCTNRAAPVFGMVCFKHKDLPKAEIRRFREARRAKRMKQKKGGSAAPKAKRRRSSSAKQTAKAANKVANKSAVKPAAKPATKPAAKPPVKTAVKPVAVAPPG